MTVQFILLQFSSRWCMHARESPYALYSISQKFSQWCLCNHFQRWPDTTFLSFQGRLWSHSSLLQAFNGVMSLGLCLQVMFYPFLTFQIFQDACHLHHLVRLPSWRPPVYLLGHFPWPQLGQGNTSTGILDSRCWTVLYMPATLLYMPAWASHWTLLYMPAWASHCPFHFLL